MEEEESAMLARDVRGWMHSTCKVSEFKHHSVIV